MAGSYCISKSTATAADVAFSLGLLCREEIGIDLIVMLSPVSLLADGPKASPCETGRLLPGSEGSGEAGPATRGKDRVDGAPHAD